MSGYWPFLDQCAMIWSSSTIFPYQKHLKILAITPWRNECKIIKTDQNLTINCFYEKKKLPKILLDSDDSDSNSDDNCHRIQMFNKVPSSEKGTKMTSKLHISKFETFSFSNKIHENSDFGL